MGNINRLSFTFTFLSNIQPEVSTHHFTWWSTKGEVGMGAGTGD